MEKKGTKVTKGPGGDEVELPQVPKHVQVLRSIALTLSQEMVLESETSDEQEIFYIYHEHLAQKLGDLGHKDPVSIINQLITHGYLVFRTTEPEPISYYIFESKKQGQEFKRKHKR